MRILFLPLALPGGRDSGKAAGALSRALPREISARAAAAGVEAFFQPFVHVIEGRRVFGVYEGRWKAEDLERLMADAPEADLLVHGELDPGDPFRMVIEILRLPNFEVVADEVFEAPRFDGFKTVEAATRFVLRVAEEPADDAAIQETPCRTFEGFLHLIRGREAAANLDGWGEGEDPEAAFEPFLLALDVERNMPAAEEELCLLAMNAAIGGYVPAKTAIDALRKLVTLVKKSWRGHASLAQVLSAAGDLNGAEAALKKALDLDPGRPSLRFDLAMTHLAQDRAGRAAKLLETVKSDAALGPSALFALGRIRADKGDEDGAIAHWRAAIELDAERVDILAALGRLHARRGEFDEANEVFTRGLDAERESGDLHLAYGVWLAEQSRYKPAVEQLGHALRLLTRAPEAELHLGRCHAAEGNRGAALHHLRKALRGPDKVSAAAKAEIEDLTSLTREERLVEMLDDAVERPKEEQEELLKALLKEESSFAEARIRLGLVLLAMGKRRGAESAFKKALKTAPDDPEALSGLASALRTRRKFKAAVEAHRKAIARAPNFAGYRLNLADTLIRMGDARAAAREVDRARALDPHHPLLPGFVVGVKLAMSEAPKRK